jgi:hypothetical protein
VVARTDSYCGLLGRAGRRCLADFGGVHDSSLIVQQDTRRLLSVQLLQFGLVKCKGDYRARFPVVVNTVFDISTHDLGLVVSVIWTAEA